MALTVFNRFLHIHQIDRAQLGLLEVGGAGSMDRSKSIKTILMAAVEPIEDSDTEGLDLSSAGYGGMASMHACTAWANSAACDGRWAITISIDHGILPFETRKTATLTGAVGLLIGRDAPAVLEPLGARCHGHAWSLSLPVGAPMSSPILDTAHTIQDSVECAKTVCNLFQASEGVGSLLSLYERIVVCTQGGPGFAHQMCDLLASQDHLSSSLAQYENKVASSLHVQARTGAPLSASLVPLCSLLLQQRELPLRACVYSCADGSSASATDRWIN